MSVLSVRMSEAEYKALEGYAAANGISMNKRSRTPFSKCLKTNMT